MNLFDQFDKIKEDTRFDLTDILKEIRPIRLRNRMSNENIDQWLIQNGVEIVDKDVVLFEEEYLLHGCNCVSRGAMGVAADIFTAFPDSNCYKNRVAPSTLGTVNVAGKICNLFCQYKPRSPDGITETRATRMQAFISCINSVIEHLKPRSIAMPYKIQCGYGGGVWSEYANIIVQIAKLGIKIRLYRFKQ